MATKPTLPRDAKRLPKGTNRHDYEPEVYAEWFRNRLRQRKARQRKRAAHRGFKDVTLILSTDARANLTEMSKAVGMSKSQFVNYLLEQCDVQPIQEKPTVDPESGVLEGGGNLPA